MYVFETLRIKEGKLSISESKPFIEIPQFDILTISAQVFGLLVTLYFFYYYSIKTTIPYFIEVKKFRAKKLIKNVKSIKTIDKDLNYNLWLINYCYKHFLK